MSKKHEIQLTMDMILQMSPTDFRDTVIGQPLGLNKSLYNLLNLQYQRCVAVKESLLALKEKGGTEVEKDLNQINTTLDDLYKSMIVIEDRATILKAILDDVEGLRASV